MQQISTPTVQVWRQSKQVEQFERLRSGSFMSARIAWDEVWTMDDSVQPLFPVPSCVVFGRRRAISKPLPDKVRAYSGTLPFRDAPEEIADQRLNEGDCLGHSGAQVVLNVVRNINEGSAFPNPAPSKACQERLNKSGRSRSWFDAARYRAPL
jgi:hypothetical protein